MHLSDYMAERKLSDSAVGSAIKRSRASVSRYRRGKMRPDWETVERIKEFTAGEVTPNDWLEEAAE